MSVLYVALQNEYISTDMKWYVCKQSHGFSLYNNYMHIFYRTVIELYGYNILIKYFRYSLLLINIILTNFAIFETSLILFTLIFK